MEGAGAIVAYGLVAGAMSANERLKVDIAVARINVGAVSQGQ